MSRYVSARPSAYGLAGPDSFVACSENRPPKLPEGRFSVAETYTEAIRRIRGQEKEDVALAERILS